MASEDAVTVGVGDGEGVASGAGHTHVLFVGRGVGVGACGDIGHDVAVAVLDLPAGLLTPAIGFNVDVEEGGSGACALHAGCDDIVVGILVTACDADFEVSAATELVAAHLDVLDAISVEVAAPVVGEDTVAIDVHLQRGAGEVVETEVHQLDADG